MFPRDAITTLVNNPNNNTVILSTSTRTLLYSKMDCESNVGLLNLTTGSNSYLIRKGGGSIDVETFSPLVTSNSLIYTEASARDCLITVTYVNRDRTITVDPPLSATSSNTVSVSNFPSGFNVNNFPSLQAVNVNNFPTLQNVNCTIGCDASTTLILSSSSIEILTTTAPTFQEWMLVVGVFLGINAIHMWNFLFGKPRVI